MKILKSDTTMEKSKLPSLAIITTVYNGRDYLQGYFNSVNQILNKYTTKINVEWVVIDAGSTDGTKEFFESKICSLDFFESRSDFGFYYGLNDALKNTKSDYYLVVGVDDFVYGDLLGFFISCYDRGYDLILGGVEIDENRFKYPDSDGRISKSVADHISHHSVGTIIKKSLHENFGLYDTSYKVLADSLFLKKVISDPCSKICYTNKIFGKFSENGFSSKLKKDSILELYRYQVSSGESKLIQSAYLFLRLIKLYLLR